MIALCKVCGKEMPLRKGKMYCSGSCKVRAFKMAKEGINIPAAPVLVYNAVRTTFFFSDYEKFSDKEFCPMLLYFFLIKNLSENENVNFLNTYVEGFTMLGSFQVDFSHDKTSQKKYIEFLEEYHNGKYFIKENRE